MNNELSVQTEQTMSSLEIAKLTEKEHFNVMRDIRKILEEVQIDAIIFEGVYKGGNGEERPCFNLPRRECDLIIAGYSAKYRLAIIDRWHELEAKQKPMTQLQMIAKMALEQDAANQRLTAVETAVARLTGDSKYMAILAWSKINHLEIPTSKAAAMGKQATAHCKLKNIEVGTVKDERYGLINTYREDILDLLFKAA
jgi:phage regulator Rha-like protein